MVPCMYQEIARYLTISLPHYFTITFPPLMNWGYRIAILYIGFVLFMLALVIGSHSISIDLVAKDYYKQEIAYEDQINRMRNTAKLEVRPAIQNDSAKRMITVQIAQHAGKELAGEVLFFRPDNPKLDLKIPLQLDSEGKQYLPTHNLQRGTWRLKVNWTHAGKEYYQEQKVKF